MLLLHSLHSRCIYIPEIRITKCYSWNVGTVEKANGKN